MLIQVDRNSINYLFFGGKLEQVRIHGPWHAAGRSMSIYSCSSGTASANYFSSFLFAAPQTEPTKGCLGGAPCHCAIHLPSAASSAELCGHTMWLDRQCARGLTRTQGVAACGQALRCVQGWLTRDDGGGPAHRTAILTACIAGRWRLLGSYGEPFFCWLLRLRHEQPRRSGDANASSAWVRGLENALVSWPLLPIEVLSVCKSNFCRLDMTVVLRTKRNDSQPLVARVALLSVDEFRGRNDVALPHGIWRRCAISLEGTAFFPVVG